MTISKTRLVLEMILKKPEAVAKLQFCNSNR
jgi:hypothetical protein